MARNALALGVAPGVASEAAGQATEEQRRQYDLSRTDTLANLDRSRADSAPWLNAGRDTLGNHAEDGILDAPSTKAKSMPVDPPVSLVNGLSLRMFNALYYGRQREKEVLATVGYDGFFYPLDKLLHWNRMYGRAGFQQYQCVVPDGDAQAVIAEVLQTIARSGAGSFLAVLKRCGDAVSPGLLSFPMPGVSLALDFAQRDAADGRLFGKLDALVHEAGGRLYPAKDAHMSATHFQKAYPAWEAVERLRDRRLMSRFWQRVTPR